MSVKIIQAGRTNEEKEFFSFKNIEEEKKKQKEESDEKMINMGIAPDDAIKNYNPDLKVTEGSDE